MRVKRVKAPARGRLAQRFVHTEIVGVSVGEGHWSAKADDFLL